MSQSGELLSGRQRWKAPEEDGTALVVPDLNACGQLLEENRRLIARLRQDEPWPGFAQLQSQLRQNLLAVARDYTFQYGDVPQDLAANDITGLPPIFLSGHQPELFHPGVWFKNFVLDALARKYGGIAINVIIDNDLERGGAISVPAAGNGPAHRQLVHYDAALPERPYEARKFTDEAVWKKFPEAIQATMGSGIPWRPLVHRWYPLATAARSCSNHIGQVFAEARHRLELSSGLKTWEVPLSHLCQHQSFATFLLHLLADLPRLHDVYNDSLEDYRRRYRLRSHSHPAPNLEQVDDVYEVPLWIWSAENPTRRRVFARRLNSDEVELTDRHGHSLVLSSNKKGTLLHCELIGLKLRPRALITTLFLRLLAGDLFIHGIGGAKYDEVTDNIARQLWNIELPRHVTATATVRLPLRPHFDPATEKLEHFERQLRNLRWHGEQELPADHPLVSEKLCAAQNEGGKLTSRERAQSLQRLNEQIFAELQSKASMIQSWLNLLRKVRAEEVVLRSREYSFVLHSEKIIPQLLDLARGKS